jgi:trans-aconitate 2-methyltransferase
VGGGARATDWDAKSYHRIAGMQEAWGLKVLDRLPLAGDEAVLDAGCGSGRMTRHVLAAVPDGRVIGVDAAPSMIAHARDELGDDPRLDLIVADLAELELSEPVDAVFSNATFHWVPDHSRLFECLFAAMRPGGQMEAQCGGQGNVAEWAQAVIAVSSEDPYEPCLRGLELPWNFAGLDETERNLERAGFEVERLSLDPVDEQPPDPAECIRASGLNAHLERLPDDGLRNDFIDAVVARMSKPLVLRYVRLNISAQRPG